MNAKLFTAAFVFAMGLSAAAWAQVPGDNPAMQGNNAAIPGDNRPIQQFAGNMGNARVAQQTVANQQPRLNNSLAPFGSALGVGGSYGSYSIGTTPAGDALRGAAEMVRGTGEAVRNGSEAAVNIETAKKLYIDNNYDSAKAFWEKRHLWADNATALRGNPLSVDQLRQIARDAAPARLSVLQLSPATGDINWPAALQRPEFDAMRSRVEDMFANRNVSNTGPGSTTQVAVERVTNAMQDDLKAQIDEMTPTEYLAAKNFLRSLAYETRYMPGVEGVAQR